MYSGILRYVIELKCDMLTFGEKNDYDYDFSGYTIFFIPYAFKFRTEFEYELNLGKCIRCNCDHRSCIVNYI